MQKAVDVLSLTTLFFYIGAFTVCVFILIKKKDYRFPLRIVLSAGTLIHFFALVLRSYYVGHAPMANLYETLLFFSFAVSVATLVYNVRYCARATELISLPVASLLLYFAIAANHSFTPLFLALKTLWFEVHVMASFAGYALFTISFSSSLFFLISVEKEHTLMRTYDDMTNSANLWGFSFFSLAMFSGAIWAYLAWGNYWFWEPKTIWSFILWFYFAGIVHGHYLKRWRGKRVAWMTIIGFGVVIFTYTGVGLLMKSSHKL